MSAKLCSWVNFMIFLSEIAWHTQTYILGSLLINLKPNINKNSFHYHLDHANHLDDLAINKEEIEGKNISWKLKRLAR
ncbi:hypothetical protein A3K86_09190 [Photobacterium jeanii]|uniref:Uncharacterized protein n=1 Tax=Photobacterium jeanii TaxID=858640 RepID=A0A178KI26_9GAMM|nr:hypothetical protein A3K86_09190 [Photobacterium jeanii]